MSKAQLTAPGANTVRYTAYPSAPGVKDPVFIYCNSTGTQKGTLQIIGPTGNGPYNFSWYQWSDITKSFSVFLRTNSLKDSSVYLNLDEGGYKVRITNSTTYDTSVIGWVFFDKPPISEAGLQQQTCYRVALKGKAATSVHYFYYRDPFNGNQVKLKNDTTFLWSSNPSSFIPGPDINLFPVIENFPPEPPYIEYRLPLTNLTYKLQVNSLACSTEATFNYESIHVKADYSLDPNKGEAPLSVGFTDKSTRATLYKWEFGDGKSSFLPNPDSNIYYKPGTYRPKLTVESTLSCIDSVRLDSVTVDPSQLSIANVFTPNGDGINDYFSVEAKSLRTISMEIFSRSGIIVYSFYGEGANLKDWRGWDGNVNNSSSKATPGVYFYIIRARGWDDIVYDGKDYRGFLYLYR